MNITVLTMITKPDERQDLWREAIQNYLSFADEVVVVVGDKKTYKKAVTWGNKESKIIPVYLEWVDDWDYIELPKHLNAGLEKCSGDWILKLDIDHLLPESQFGQLRQQLNLAEQWDVTGLQLEKMSFYANGKFRLKGKQTLLFKNRINIAFGDAIDLEEKHKDLCQIIDVSGYREIDGYALPFGRRIKAEASNLLYINYNYTFKTRGVARTHFWRFVRAYINHFNSDVFGKDEESSWKYFKTMMKDGYNDAIYDMKLYEHPASIRNAIENLQEEQLGYNLWRWRL